MEKEILSEIRKTNRRLNIIKEEVSLGTLDNTILALIVFFIAIGISMLSLTTTEIIQKIPIIIVPFFSILMLILPLLAFIVMYVPSIIHPEGKFTSKIYALTFLSFNFFSIILFFITSLFLIVYETKNGTIPIPYFGEGLAVVIFVISLIITILVRPKIKEYFTKYYPCMIFRRMNNIGKKDKEKTEKFFKIKYSELKRRSNLEKN